MQPQLGSGKALLLTPNTTPVKTGPVTLETAEHCTENDEPAVGVESTSMVESANAPAQEAAIRVTGDASQPMRRNASTPASTTAPGAGSDAVKRTCTWLVSETNAATSISCGVHDVVLAVVVTTFVQFAPPSSEMSTSHRSVFGLLPKSLVNQYDQRILASTSEERSKTGESSCVAPPSTSLLPSTLSVK